ncbi:MAG: hypothetical protein KC456_09260 [Flavobacteriales bacterium]|nr:hypothetical protein [Flavobacteriales bacterium]
MDSIGGIHSKKSESEKVYKSEVHLLSNLVALDSRLIDSGLSTLDL